MAAAAKKRALLKDRPVPEGHDFALLERAMVSLRDRLAFDLPKDPKEDDDGKALLRSEVIGVEKCLSLVRKAAAGKLSLDDAGGVLVKVERAPAPSRDTATEDRLRIVEVKLEAAEAQIADLRRRFEAHMAAHLAVDEAVVPITERTGFVSKSRAKRVAAQKEGDSPLSKAAHAILVVLYQRRGFRTSLDQLAALAHYSRRTGVFIEANRELRAAGDVVVQGGNYRLTFSGDSRAESLGMAAWMPSGDGPLLAYWTRSLPNAAAAKVLAVLHADYPKAFSRDELAVASGYSPRTGVFIEAVRTLRRLDLATKSWPVKRTAHLGAEKS